MNRMELRLFHFCRLSICKICSNWAIPRATISAVIFIYIIVTFGCVMLVGADTLVEQKEVALAVAGKAALGTLGLVLVTIAAAFSTGSAINATLFSTGRLMEKVAEKKDLANLFAKENSNNIPYYAILFSGWHGCNPCGSWKSVNPR